MDNSSQTTFRLASTLTSVDGVVHFAGINKDFLNDIRELPVRKDDVFIASYPKSGTAWMCELVWQIHTEGKVDTRRLFDRVPFIEILKFLGELETKNDLQNFYVNHPSPRIFKTHLRYHELPMGGTDKPKYIYVMRNPKDVAVSFYHHYKGLEMYEFSDGTWDEFFEMFIDNKVQYSSWFDHVLGWLPHKDDDNVLLLKYEDMKKDLLLAVQQISKFLGKDLSQEITQQIAGQTTFKAMAANQELYLYGENEFQFIRKGDIGDWKNYFTEEQNRRFDELYEKKMAGSGLKLEFEW